MVNAVVIFLAFLRRHTDSHGHAFIALTNQVTMVKSVVFTIHHHPEISFKPFRLIKIINHNLCHARIISKKAFILAKANHFLGWGMAVFEYKTANFEIFTAETQIRLPCEDNLTFCLCR